MFTYIKNQNKTYLKDKKTLERKKMKEQRTFNKMITLNLNLLFDKKMI